MDGMLSSVFTKNKYILIFPDVYNFATYNRHNFKNIEK